MDALNDFARRRYQVLFEVWVPSQDELQTHSQLCENCGFVIYTPRPTEKDVDAKYRFLVEHSDDVDSRPPIDSQLSQQRSSNLYRLLGPRVSGTGARILDFGGDDGRLLQHFVDRGDECFVVDYYSNTLPGVTKLGDTLDEIGPQEPFDAVICSHVLEHVVDPLTIVRRIRELLAPSGILYVEVPMEIWKRPPLLEEPVTHVNFFTHSSLAYLLENAGYRVTSCRTEGLSLPQETENLRSRVVRAFATPSNQRSRPRSGGPELARRLLQPGISTRLWQAMLHPSAIPSGIWNRISKPRSGRT